MARPLPCVILAASVAASAATLFAQPPPPPGSLNTWVDACQATAPDLQALLANEALLVHETFLDDNDDGTWALRHQPFTMSTGGNGQPEHPMCTHARFYGQTRVEVPGYFRSVVQVGPALVLTAWHGEFTLNAADFRVVFGVHGRLVGNWCVPPDFSRIPASDIYSVHVVADGMAPPDDVDYLLLGLDRETANAYPRVRRSGRAYPGDSVTVVGHPERLPAKVDTAGVAGDTTAPFGREWLDVANVHLLVGSSGSMLYNRTQRVLEAVASVAGRGANIELDPETAPACYVITHESLWRSRNASLRYFAQNIPRYELLVDPLDWVVLKAPVGTPIAHSSKRTLEAPPGAAIQYQIVPPASPPAGQPTLTISAGGPLQGTLPPGQTLDVVQNAAASASVPCNVYERTYLVRDLTHGFEDVARHVFEIGKRGFSVTGGRDGFDDLAAPFEESVSYTVTNTQPSPFTLKVSSDQPWVSFNGSAGPFYLTFQPYEAKQVAIGVLDAYSILPHPAPYDAQVTFEVAPDGTGCPVSPPVTRLFAFRYGTESFKWSGSVTIPAAEVVVTQTVAEAACIGDVNVSIATEGVDVSELRFWLKAPNGFETIIWNPGDAPDPHALELDEGALNLFEGLGTYGAWSLTAVDAVPSPAPGKLKSWSLHFTSCPSP